MLHLFASNSVLRDSTCCSNCPRKCFSSNRRSSSCSTLWPVGRDGIAVASSTNDPIGINASHDRTMIRIVTSILCLILRNFVCYRTVLEQGSFEDESYRWITFTSYRLKCPTVWATEELLYRYIRLRYNFFFLFFFISNRSYLRLFFFFFFFGLFHCTRPKSSASV